MDTRSGSAWVCKSNSISSNQQAGIGKAQYPTIDSFEYEENLSFEVYKSRLLIHYEQKTKLLPSGEQSHWESGFIRPLENGLIEISNSQNNGRVEVLQGQIDMNSLSEQELKIEFASVVLAHDPKMVETKRVLTVKADVLHYILLMSTNTTPEPNLTMHLEAVLKRISV